MWRDHAGTRKVEQYKSCAGTDGGKGARPAVCANGVCARACVCVCLDCALFALAERQGEKREEVKHLAVKHFNQGASNPA